MVDQRSDFAPPGQVDPLAGIDAAVVAAAVRAADAAYDAAYDAADAYTYAEKEAYTERLEAGLRFAQGSQRP